MFLRLTRSFPCRSKEKSCTVRIYSRLLMHNRTGSVTVIVSVLRCCRCRSKISRFQIISFLREFSFYLRHLRHCADQRNPWSRWSSKKRLFLEKLFFKRVLFLPATAAPKTEVCHSKRSYSRQMVCKIFYFMGFQAAVFML